MTLTIFPLPGIPEIAAGDDLARIIGDAVSAGVSTSSTTGGVSTRSSTGASDGLGVRDGDIIAITSKIVSKAEGRLIRADDREDAITRETVRVVATREHPGGVTRIVENTLGLVLAAAGVDSSNVPDGHVLLLPVDPDASARNICAQLRERFGVRVGVIVSDTLGRPWRQGQTDVAIGAAGIRVLDDLRGSTDAGGRTLEVTVAATADEIAGAADLVKGKARGLPVAIVRGLGHLVGELDEPGAASIVRPADQDMFRLGSDEAWREGYEAGLRAAAERVPGGD